MLPEFYEMPELGEREGYLALKKSATLYHSYLERSSVHDC